MKKKILTVAVALMAVAVTTTFTSCKKNTTNDTPATTQDNTAAQTQNASDDARVNSEIDNATSDANSALTFSPSVSGKLAGNTINLPCDVKLDTSLKSTGIITILYDSSTCYGYYLRYGSIKLQLLGFATGTKWKDAGATVQVTFINYRVKRVADGKSITFNGTKTITNVTGGLVVGLTGTNTIQHRIRANGLSITFDNGQVRTWSVARLQTWSINSGAYQVSISGDTSVTVNSKLYNNVVVWGTTRLGENFAVTLSSPIVANSYCGWYHPTAGVRTIYGISSSLALTLGVDGTPAHSPVGVFTGSNCAWGYTLAWTGPKGNTLAVSLQY